MCPVTGTRVRHSPGTANLSVVMKPGPGQAGPAVQGPISEAMALHSCDHTWGSSGRDWGCPELRGV